MPNSGAKRLNVLETVLYH